MEFGWGFAHFLSSKQVFFFIWLSFWIIDYIPNCHFHIQWFLTSIHPILSSSYIESIGGIAVFVTVGLALFSKLSPLVRALTSLLIILDRFFGCSIKADTFSSVFYIRFVITIWVHSTPVKITVIFIFSPL